MPNRAICKLSIIVPVHNVEQYIERCMISLLQFPYEWVEIICIDDGSTDGSGQKCEEFALRDKRVNVIYQASKGPLLARNTGLSSARGEYISFVDSDDWIDSRLLEDFIAFMDCNPDVDLCIGGTVREYPDGSVIPMFEESLPRMFHRDEALAEMISGRFFFWYMWGKVYRRTVFEGFSADETVTTGEDLDSLWQLFTSGKVRNVWYSPKYKYHYYYNTCGMTESKKRIERYKSDLYVFEKILKGSDKGNAGMMDQIRIRALQSIYSILREWYFLNGQFGDIRFYRTKAVTILNQIVADEQRKSITAQRMRRITEDEGYARDFFEYAFSSMRKAASEAKGFSKKYIYGTGIVSQYMTVMVQEAGDFDGFVISDGRPSTLTFAGKPVYHRSELTREEEKAVVLAVNRKHQKEIMEGLDADGNTTVLIPDIPEDF